MGFAEIIMIAIKREGSGFKLQVTSFRLQAYISGFTISPLTFALIHHSPSKKPPGEVAAEVYII